MSVARWHREKKSLSLREQVDLLCLKRLGRCPDLNRPSGYNDIIQWLKLNDQTPEHVVACDKYAVRELVARDFGESVLNHCYYVADSVLPNDFTADDYMLKATHDSGSVYRIRGSGDIEAYGYARRRVTDALTRPYGTHKGEWAYAMVKPRVMAEEALPEPVIDYKFHCTHGKVRWVQVIWARNTGTPREAIFLPSGAITGLHMDHKMAHRPLQRMYPGDVAWSELTRVAEALAKRWRYVRVDLYYVPDVGVRFGELTFWPLSGSYKTKDEPTFGEMLEIDLSYKHEPMVT